MFLSHEQKWTIVLFLVVLLPVLMMSFVTTGVEKVWVGNMVGHVDLRVRHDQFLFPAIVFFSWLFFLICILVFLRVEEVRT